MSGALRVDRRQRLFLALLAALVALAWAALWAWSRSAYGGYLQHDDWTASGPAAALCRALPGGTFIVPAALYAGAWIVMTAAMMLPTTLPLLDVFARLSAARPDRGRLLAAVVLGYMLVWGGFGLLAHGLHAGLLWLAGRFPALGWDGWTFGAAVIAAAGAFQFSALKRRCLDQCRSPLGFVIEHWRGRAHARQALALGAHHGLFCVGCCWALMLLMFAFAAGSLGWMLLLAAVMAVEKNLGWGRHLGAPLGAALLAWSGVMVLSHVAGSGA
jgi:predicted metal-binding membrane protein